MTRSPKVIHASIIGALCIAGAAGLFALSGLRQPNYNVPGATAGSETVAAPEKHGRIRTLEGEGEAEVKMAERSSAERDNLRQGAGRNGAPGRSGMDPSEETRKMDELSAKRHDRLQQLVSQLRENPEMAADIVEQIWAENDEEMIGLLVEALIATSDVTARHLPLASLMKHAKTNGSPAKRAAALRLLSRAPDITDEMIHEVGNIAHADPDNQIKVSAISTMNSWMMFHKNMGEAIASEVMLTRELATDPQVRGISIQAVANQDLPMKGALMDSMIASLNEDVPMNRALAALGLARGATDETRPRIMQELSQAFDREKEMYVKRNLLGLMVLGGNNESLEYLNRISTDDPVIQQDVRDYVQLLQSGATDMDKLLTEKSIMDDQRGTSNHLPEQQFEQSRQL